MRGLSDEQIDGFLEQGFVHLPNAFPRSLADEGRVLLWRDTGCDPNNPSTWTQPVIRLGGYSQEPFVRAANTELLHRAFDQLAGEGNWLPLTELGTFPVRFPSPTDPGDAGWHVDTSFATTATDPNDFLDWRVNVTSKGRALLLLFLFSDIEANDAPTRIRAGSHLDMARRLAPAGEEGLSLRELAATGFEESANRPEVHAAGEAGTVYLCHPLLVHAAQPHRGRNPRFLAQPPLLPARPFALERETGEYSPVERSIRNALGLTK